MKMLSFHNALFGREEQDVLLQLDASSVSSGIHLMIAPNGSGKSTFLQTVGGVLTLKSGHFKLDSRRFVPHKQGLYFSEYLSFHKSYVSLQRCAVIVEMHI